MEKIKRFLKGEEGVTSLEYGVIAAVIVVAALVGALPAVRDGLKSTFGSVAGAL